MLKLILNWFALKSRTRVIKAKVPYGLEHLEVVSAEKWFN